MSGSAADFAENLFRLGRKPISVFKSLKRLKFKVGRRSVFRWYEKFTNKNPVSSRKPGSGRKQRIQGALRRTLKTAAAKEHFTARQWSKQHRVPHATTDRTLGREDVDRVARVRPKSFLILPQNKTKRVDFAIKFQKKKKQYWRRCSFTDSKYFGIGSSGRVFVWVKRGKRASPIPRLVRNGPKIHVYAALNWFGTSDPIILRKNAMNVNADSYVKDVLPKLVDFSFRSIGQNHVFMQDGATPHSAKKTKEWIARCTKLKEVLMKGIWPPQSPDLNPIENFWGYIQAKVEGRQPKTERGLVRTVKAEFKKVPLELCHNLINSMGSRLEEVIAVNGNKVTNY